MLWRLFSGPRKEVGVRVSAFGKHPGERDHFAMNPSDSPRLTGVWDMFYARGFKDLVPQWKQMPAEERVERYAHVFTWQTEEGVVVGRMWSSQDGARPPRKDFPFVVCVECRGVPLGRAVRDVLPSLEKVEQRCGETDSIEAVGTIIRSAEAEISRAAAGAGEGRAATRGVEILSDAVDLPGGTGERGFERVMYCLCRDLDVAPDSAGRRPQKKRLERAVQLRVPRGERPAAEACAFWTEFVLEFAEEGTEMLCVASTEEKWVDVIAGPAQPGHLACIRANTLRTPMTVDVPYEIDSGFAGACGALLEMGRKAAARGRTSAPTGTGAKDATTPSRAASIQPAKEGAGSGATAAPSVPALEESE